MWHLVKSLTYILYIIVTALTTYHAMHHMTLGLNSYSPIDLLQCADDALRNSRCVDEETRGCVRQLAFWNSLLFDASLRSCSFSF